MGLFSGEVFYDHTEAAVAMVIRNSQEKKSMENNRCITHRIGVVAQNFSRNFEFWLGAEDSYVWTGCYST